MIQRLTITVTGGKRGMVLPEDVARALDLVPQTLCSIDANMWQVGQPRFHWQIDSASKNSPLTITLAAILTIQDAPPIDVVRVYMDGVTELQSGRTARPEGWTNADLERTASLSKAGKSGSIQISADDRTIIIGDKVGRAAEDALRAAPTAVILKYGSITGVLRQVTVDTRDKRQTSRFQLIDQESGAVVECDFTPDRSRELRVTTRLVAYGDIVPQPDGTPKKIRVEDFRVLPDKLPLLRDLQAMRINITDGEDSADYINRAREDIG